MANIEVIKLDNLNVQLLCEPSIQMEIRNKFSFYAEGYKWMPKYKMGLWDGKINLFDLRTKKFYIGLIPELKKFCDERGYTIDCDDSIIKTIDYKEDIRKFLEKISNFCSLKPRDYQINAFIGSLIENKAIVLSPTGSGKSLIIYLIIRFLLENSEDFVLLVVPTTNLVEQMYNDFKSYDPSGIMKNRCHLIYSGKQKLTNKRVVITTWQSIFRLPQEWFKKFNILIVDEVHLADAPSLTKIIQKMSHSVIRIGFTGTLSGSKVNEMSLKGLFGKILRTSTTKELMDSGNLAELEIKVLKLMYPIEERKFVSELKEYKDEISFLINHEKRNKLIQKLAIEKAKQGNVLLLFLYELHGKEIYAKIKNKVQEEKVHLVYGGTSIQERENIRYIVENTTNNIICASYGVFSTGVNIVNINSVIFAHPSKSRIRNLQSIGRGLRIGKNKTKVVLFDIFDDLDYNNTKSSIVSIHAIERLKIYKSEGFKYGLYEIAIK